MLAPDWVNVGNVWHGGFCLYKPLTNIIWCQTLGILRMDLISVCCASQYSINLLHIWLKSWGSGAGEMAQWLRALAALLEVLSSVPSNHMVTQNHL